jgi:threonine dehydrogenase-like Zn-dependent dehydrogenase
MKAAFVKRKGKVKISEVFLPDVGDNEILIRINACGVCGSDFIEASHWAKEWKQFGHELSGTIHTIGGNNTDFDKGDRVVLATSVPCGECSACRKGLPRHCPQMVIANQGGFAEYLLIKDSRLLKTVSLSVPSNVACLAEPLTVILDAFHLVRLEKNDVFWVAGGGFIGMLAILTAHLMGISVAGVFSRRSLDNLQKVLEYTGGECLKWGGFGALSTFKNILSGRSGRTVVLHTAPPYTIASYCDKLPYDSAVVNIGLSGKKKENRLSLDISKAVFNRTQILNAFPVPCLFLEEAVSLLENHTEVFSMLDTYSVSLDDLPRIIASRSKNGKAIVTIGE